MLQADEVCGVEGGQLPARPGGSPQHAVPQVRGVQVVLGVWLCFQVHPGRERDQLSLSHVAGSQPHLAWRHSVAICCILGPRITFHLDGHVK